MDDLTANQLVARVATLEAQVAWLMQTMQNLSSAAPTAGGAGTDRWGRPVDSGLSKEVVRLATSGNKIAAIKLYRELTGVGLREAKDAVDAIR